MGSVDFDSWDWIILDVDGVLIDVSESYDVAVRKTVKYFLSKDFNSVEEIDLDLVRDIRKKGSFGDDFKVSEALIIGYEVTNDLKKFVADFPSGEGIEWVRESFGDRYDIGEIKEIFNTFYLGKEYEDRVFEYDGLWRNETPIVDTDLLSQVEDSSYKLGVITGRSSLELRLAEKVLDFNFKNSVCREEAVKPNSVALKLLVDGGDGVYIGDTINDQFLVENYRKEGGEFDFLMVERDIEDVNELLGKVLDI